MRTVQNLIRYHPADRDCGVHQDPDLSEGRQAGNKVARYFVGMGAGQQEIEIECVLKDKKTGSVLAREVILDRKVGGIAGGDAGNVSAKTR